MRRRQRRQTDSEEGGIVPPEAPSSAMTTTNAPPYYSKPKQPVDWTTRIIKLAILGVLLYGSYRVMLAQYHVIRAKYAFIEYVKYHFSQKQTPLQVNDVIEVWTQNVANTFAAQRPSVIDRLTFKEAADLYLIIQQDELFKADVDTIVSKIFSFKETVLASLFSALGLLPKDSGCPSYVAPAPPQISLPPEQVTFWG